MSRRHASLAVGTLALVALTASAAVAAPPTTAPDTADVAALGIGPGADQLAVAEESLFFAGFSDVEVGDTTTSAEFKVPELSCGEVDEGMVTTLWAISEEGDFLAGPDLFTYCSGGEYFLSGHVTTSGGQIPIWQDLQPGDTVQMSITKLASGPSTHDVSFTSLTRGWASTLPTNSPIERIEIGHRRMSLDGVSIPVPDYGRERFKNVVFDDVPLDQADATRWKLVDEEGTVLIKAKRGGDHRFRLISKVG